MSPLRLIGYWRTDGDATSAYAHPGDWVDWGWDRDERGAVGWYFASGTLLNVAMGHSLCRICGRPNGAVEYTDGTYVWPEGLAHYVDEHSVRLPAEVVAHALSRSELLLDGATVSDRWWLDQPKVREGTVSSATSADPTLPPPDPVADPAIREYADDGPDQGYLDPHSVWLVMAELLVAQGGHRILASTAQGTLSAERAEVAWTERHRMSDADYQELVDRARAVVANRDSLGR